MRNPLLDHMHPSATAPIFHTNGRPTSLFAWYSLESTLPITLSNPFPHLSGSDFCPPHTSLPTAWESTSSRSSMTTLNKRLVIVHFEKAHEERSGKKICCTFWQTYLSSFVLASACFQNPCRIRIVLRD